MLEQFTVNTAFGVKKCRVQGDLNIFAAAKKLLQSIATGLLNTFFFEVV